MKLNFKAYVLHLTISINIATSHYAEAHHHTTLLRIRGGLLRVIYTYMYPSRSMSVSYSHSFCWSSERPFLQMSTTLESSPSGFATAVACGLVGANALSPVTKSAGDDACV